MSVKPMGERLAALEQRITDHESRCEERLVEIKADGAATRSTVEGLQGRIWLLVIALLAWALAQLWAANQARFEGLESSREPVPMLTPGHGG